jgi:hypothetical protein
VKLASCIVLVAVFLSAEETATKNAVVRPANVTVKMYAVEASFVKEAKEKTYDSDLKAIKDTLFELNDYNTFRKIEITSENGTFGKEMALKINARYTLYVTPIERDTNGRIRLNTRIEEKAQGRPTDNPINALSAQSCLVPNDKLLLGGPTLNSGKLVIVLTVVPQS